MGQPKHHSPKTPNFDPLILFFKHKLQTSEFTGLSHVPIDCKSSSAYLWVFGTGEEIVVDIFILTMAEERGGGRGQREFGEISGGLEEKDGGEI